ncbi:MAG: molybdate ABC transporter permease subunit [Anaerolineae bacterium]|nr:molybdate ABC transporter permease subunit [Candidatus Roseilinea sp.]MDW8450248.1 molybdate ABC transporter permease subunit [Anaerolineae bacterium]
MLLDRDWTPLELSLWISTWAGVIALVLGTALAWIFARFAFRGKWLVEGMTMLPLVLPPTVLGYYLLVALGRRGIGPAFEQVFGFSLVFSWQGAVVAAVIAALPLVVQAVKPSILDLSREMEDAARVDGCGELQVLRYITLPLIRASLVGGGILAFLRALGEFGATLMVAGNIPGRTQTLSMAVYDAVQANNLDLANQLVLLLSAITFALLFVALRLGDRTRHGDLR